jgi:N-acetylneuraminic acid mutarotase
MIGWGGGCCDSQANDGAAYTLATNSWKRLPPSPLLGRHAAGVWTGKEMIIAGGYGYAGFRPGGEPISVHFADAAAYDPTTRTWRNLPRMPISRGGGYHTVTYSAVWDGTEMLVVGGTDRPSESADPLARGVAYNPAANTWRWLAPIEFPRTGFVCAWTGHQLVVWGGTAVGGTIPPHGETYDPVMNIWSALPRAPLSARTDAVAVWTGHELIIWGGVDARTGDTLSDGAVFTPASD